MGGGYNYAHNDEMEFYYIKYIGGDQNSLYYNLTIVPNIYKIMHRHCSITC